MADLQSMNVAIVHDWLTGYRGGEKVLNEICALFPGAPLHTLVHIPGTTSKTIENRDIHTSFLQMLPNPGKYYRHYLPFFPLAAETLGTSNYDLIISTSSAVAKSVPVGSAKHWCYIHSPMRYVWDRFDDYFGSEKVGTIPSTLLFKPVASLLRGYDKKTSRRVSHFVSNSNFVANRVKSFYDRDAETIYPPVELERFDHSKRSPEDFYLYFSALVPYKKAEHAIEACQKLGRKLVIVGDGPELGYLKSLVTSDLVQFKGRVSDEEVTSLYARAKALLFPGVEDLGIIPMEASASGLPVIGYKMGGLTETQTNETCIFYDDQSVNGLVSAIKEFEERLNEFHPDKLRKQSENFSKKIFQEKVLNSILRTVST